MSLRPDAVFDDVEGLRRLDPVEAAVALSTGQT